MLDPIAAELEIILQWSRDVGWMKLVIYVEWSYLGDTALVS